MSKFFLGLRYLCGGLFTLIAIVLFYEKHNLVVLFLTLIISVLILIPPSLKLCGYTGVLDQQLSTGRFFTPYMLFSFCRWLAGLFYCLGAIGDSNIKYGSAVMLYIVGAIMISPLDRFFFPRMPFFQQKTDQNRISAVYLLRNHGIVLLYFAPAVYDLFNKSGAYVMFITGIGALVWAGLIALKLRVVISSTAEPNTFAVLTDFGKSVKKFFTIKLPPRPVKPVKEPKPKPEPKPEPKPKPAPKPAPEPKPKKHKVPKYADAYTMRWKLKPSNTTSEFLQELIRGFQENWLAANEYDERLNVHRDKEEHKKQTIRMLTDYIQEIRDRRELIDTINGKIVSIPDQVSEIWRADKRLRSLFSAMEKYSKQRGAKELWIFMVNIAEYRAMINLVKRIKHSQVKEVSPRLIKRSQQALLQTSLYSNPAKVSVLDMNTYFQIIDYIILLGKNLENYKELNDKFNEERYRDYFLPFLNAVNPAYSAKGEVFNRLGKTDILICDSHGNNIFIAECKLWRGEAYLVAAIDQLLNNYVNWRDEKTAIIIFNREMKQFSKLITTATEVMSRHPLCLRAAGKRSESSWSYLFRHPDDNNKVIRLELVLFNFA